MNLLNVKAITKKEIKSYINNPAAYIVLVAFSLMWQFLFFKNALIIGESSLRGLFEVLPWLLLIFIPAITMGSISKEKDEGTLELILTHPIHDQCFYLYLIRTLIYISARFHIFKIRKV